MLEEEVFPFRIFCIFHNFTSNFSLYHMNNCSIIFFLLNVRTGEASSPFININVHLHPKSIQTIMIVINFTMIYMVTKVSSAILLANVGLLLGGFALTNIDKVMMIKKKGKRCKWWWLWNIDIESGEAVGWHCGQLARRRRTSRRRRRRWG